LHFLEDETTQVVEPPRANSGLPQGKKRKNQNVEVFLKMGSLQENFNISLLLQLRVKSILHFI